MLIPEALIVLAGFVFAHAAWNVSDLPKGELLVPLAIVQESNENQLIRFEGESQVEAIGNAKTYLARLEDTVDAWVFAREGQVEEAGEYVDVLTIEAKAKGMEDSIVFIQRFQPFAKGEFKLLGPPVVIVAGEIVVGAESNLLLEQLQAGIQSHGQVAPLWSDWISD